MAFCTACGTELPQGARFCPGCGATSAPATSVASPAPPPAAAMEAPGAAGHPATFAQPVRGGAGWILPAVIIAAVAVIALLLLRPNDRASGAAEQTGAGTQTAARDETSVRTADADADGERRARASGGGNVLSAATLDAAFSRDPAGAAALYSGPVRVSGVIATMVQPGPTPALSLEGRTRFNYMVVNFPAGYREQLAPLAKGQFIQLSCDRARGFAGTTILDGCALE